MIKKRINGTHRVFSRYLERWVMNLDFLAGGLEVISPSFFTQRLSFAIATEDSNPFDDELEESVAISGKFKWVHGDEPTYLFTHEREKRNRFIQRQQRAARIPLTGPVLESYNDTVFGQPVKYNGSTDTPVGLEDFFNDCTGSGTTYYEFIKDFALIAMSTGACHAYLHTKLNPTPVSAAHDLGNMPYIKTVSPVSMFNWDTDEFGNYKYACFFEPDTANEDTSKSVNQVRYCDTEYVRIFRLKADSMNRKQEWVEATEEAFEHGLGRVPIFTLKIGTLPWDQQTHQPFFPDMSDFDRRIYNMLSLLDTIDWNQTFSLLVLPGGAAGANTPMNIGVFEALAIDLNNGDAKYISPDSGIAVSFWNRIKEQLEVFAASIGHSRGKSELSKEARSAAAISAEQSQKLSKIKKLANRLATFERKLLSAVSAIMKTKSPTVEYPQDFDIYALDRKIKSLFDLTAMKINNAAMSPVVSNVIEDVMKKFGVESSEINASKAAIKEKPYEAVVEAEKQLEPPDFRMRGMQEANGGKQV